MLFGFFRVIWPISPCSTRTKHAQRITTRVFLALVLFFGHVLRWFRFLYDILIYVMAFISVHLANKVCFTKHVIGCILV
jgi:hypothetical protein